MMTSCDGNAFRVTGAWPFVWGIHRSPVDAPNKGPVTTHFEVFFDISQWIYTYTYTYTYIYIYTGTMEETLYLLN